MNTGFEQNVSDLDQLPSEAALAFAPLHKRALGVACGLLGALLIAGITAFHMVALQGDESGLSLLGEYFAGYTVSWPGVFVGALWGFATSFVFGWFAAFVRNLVLATYLFVARTRAELEQTRDFLDHI